MKIIILLVHLLIYLCNAQTRPQLPEIFQSRIAVDIKSNGSNPDVGYGVWISNQPKGESLEEWVFDRAPQRNNFLLQRYDLGVTYSSEVNAPCLKTGVTGEMPRYWDWIKIANFSGHSTRRGIPTERWELTMGYATVGIEVSSNPGRTTPMSYWRFSPARNVTIEFLDFEVTEPNPIYFSVPNYCEGAPNSVADVENNFLCGARATMIARAAVWVNAKVPYNIDGRYDGYREDCSGYVSYIWELGGPGRVTQTLPGVSHKITKAELAEGDIILDTAEHVVLFGGWADSAKTQYTAYEETRPGEGTVKRVTPYPYWYNTAAFVPYRYNSVC